MKTVKNNDSFALTRVRIFDGDGLTGEKTVFVKNGMIADSSSSDIIIDGEGMALLPGLIDSHIHLNDIENLEQASRYGVTTMLDMMTESPGLVDSLRNRPGLSDIRSCYGAAMSGGGMMASFIGGVGRGMITNAEDAENFVNGEIAKGADYIKLILEGQPMTAGMLSADIIRTIVKTAHDKNRIVFAHTTTVPAYRSALAGGVDVVTHIPRTEILPGDIIEEMVEKKTCIVPTMIMQKGMAESFRQKFPDRAGSLEICTESLRLMHEAGVTIIAGTDANHTNQLNYVPHGSSLHEEFELMAAAGFSPVEILRSATSVPAQKFDFIADRGSIETGKRADFLLVEGDPTQDIRTTRNIRNVWIRGIEVNR